ncbi:hypothetical protein KP509_31G055900 [Ceratopteris richardii]|nr:hypothetical protein KP509_31G055900 [Ceratopteris richardii]
MLITCGDVYTAQQVFEKLTSQAEHAWTSILHGYVECGEPHLALKAFQHMKAGRVRPSTHTFVVLIKACEDLRDLERGRELHAVVVCCGYETDPFVNNSLLCMYAKCESIADVENVFDHVPVQDIVAWTALMTAYIECDLNEEALDCLAEIHSEGVRPDAVMFVCSLKACASLKAIDKGQMIHKEIIEEGLERLPPVGNTLIDMYAKSGLFEEAQQLFNELPCRDVITWTTLIAGYAENGQDERAVRLLEQMQCENIVLDEHIYVTGLKACCSSRSIHKGFEMHIEIAVEGFETYKNIANTLIDMYSKLGLLEEAQGVFDELDSPDVVSWTALIAGYAEHGFHVEVQRCLNQMQKEGCYPNVPTFICSLKACSLQGSLDWGHKMHTRFVKEGFENDALISCALVDMYAKHSSFAEAEAVLNFSSDQNVASWNALITGFAEQGASEAALECLDRMENFGLSSNEITLLSSLKACSKSVTSRCGYRVHNEIVKKGFETPQTCGNALVDMYGKCGLLTDAQAVFDKLKYHDVIGWTSLIAGYADHGFREEALKHLKQMQLEGVPLDIILWNIAIACHAEEEEIEEALVVHASMHEQGILFNCFSFMTALQVCAKTASIEVGRRLHIHIQAFKDFDDAEDLLSTALIDMYAKCGSMNEALQVFEQIRKKSLVQWNAIISGYACQVESKLVFWTFNQMMNQCLQPDALTFNSILFACSHSGLLKEGEMFYEAMVEEHNILPQVRHDNCMIGLLGRSGCLNEAVLMLEKIPFSKDSVSWNSVLGACRRSGDLELSEQTFNTLVTLGQQNTTSFVMMANVYADIGK